ncbi:MAG: ATP-dependent Clp protease proteolytic subunit [Thermodesulfovibrionia bacterium]|nr:ATP-dependent Clp protease proteolytic subunit [Thermodesulfovibrionia bacterium]
MKTWGEEPPKEEDKGKDQIIFEKPSILETTGNRIYFYSPINTSSILKLNQALSELSWSHMASQQNRQQKEPDSIFLNINSYGGGIFAGLAGMDTIIRVKKEVPIVTTVDGCCASAGTFLSIVGTKRLINSNSYMLIHQLSSVMWGKFQEFKDEMQNLEKLMEAIKKIYKQYTEVPEDQLDEILKHDIWFDAKTCLKYKLVDEII